MEYFGGVLPVVTDFPMIRHFVYLDITMEFPFFRNFFTRKPDPLKLEAMRNLKEASIGLDVSEFMYLNQWFQTAFSMPLSINELDKLMDMVALTYGQVMIVICNVHDSFSDPFKDSSVTWHQSLHLKEFMEGDSLNSYMIEVMLSLEHMLIEERYYPAEETDLLKLCKATSLHHWTFALGCPPVTFQSGLFSRYLYLINDNIMSKCLDKDGKKE